MKFICTTFLVFIAVFFNGQNKSPEKRGCGTEIPDRAWDDWFNSKVEEFTKSNSAAKGETVNYTIPVIFHVVHGGQSVGTFPNISQAQINSQVTVLNNDYAGNGFNVGNFSGTGFAQSLIANCNITFCLAEKDPAGATLSESGIHRVDYTSQSWANPTSFGSSANFKNYIENTVKANTIWDPSRYLNIWVTDVNSSVGLLGYATFPPGSGLSGVGSGLGTITDDGVWCWARAVGDLGTLSSNYNRGRTATHEIGHYLGLRHIWGDVSCGTDYCNDTPTQQQENTTCPSYPHVTCSNGPNGDMFMNFMDYCYDYCLYMFTNDQSTRMQVAMANSPLRKFLSASSATLCGQGQVVCSYTVSNFSNTDTIVAFRRATAPASNTFCPQGTGKAGYINGTNCYEDKEKAEFISASKYSNVVGPHVSGVIVLFFQYGNFGTDGTGNVSLNIYKSTSATSSPGILLGSITENLATIAATTNTTQVSYCGNPSLAFNLPLMMPYKFTFPNPVPVAGGNGFFASVVLPTSSNDTVVIMDKLTATSNTAWEKWDDNTWNDMKTAWGGTRNFNLAILPIVECGPLGLNKNTVFSSGIDVFPNPSEGRFSIVTTLVSAENLQLDIFNVVGESVFHENIKNAQKNLIDVNLSDRPAGVYFVQIRNGEEKIVKRLVLTH